MISSTDTPDDSTIFATFPPYFIRTFFIRYGFQNSKLQTHERYRLRKLSKDMQQLLDGFFIHACPKSPTLQQLAQLNRKFSKIQSMDLLKLQNPGIEPFGNMFNMFNMQPKVKLQPILDQLHQFQYLDTIKMSHELVKECSKHPIVNKIVFESGDRCVTTGELEYYGCMLGDKGTCRFKVFACNESGLEVFREIMSRYKCLDLQVDFLVGIPGVVSKVWKSYSDLIFQFSLTCYFTSNGERFTQEDINILKKNPVKYSGTWREFAEVISLGITSFVDILISDINGQDFWDYQLFELVRRVKGVEKLWLCWEVEELVLKELLAVCGKSLRQLDLKISSQHSLDFLTNLTMLNTLRVSIVRGSIEEFCKYQLPCIKQQSSLEHIYIRLLRADDKIKRDVTSQLTSTLKNLNKISIFSN
eukprot:TRINITY_DN1598_c0_g3_i1.p1 TRINITY_DN1598_c0_g3~~TRINITY_DN1598_c0_g3_i1.p1  ORF type:complete len:442 (-),score=41.73 TRINITY_DN1598_c0_g3_i1:3946-5193(-)